MTVPAIRPLSGQVWALLDAIANVNAFDGEPVIPAPKPAGQTDPFWDPDGRVHAYAVYYPSPGRRTSSRLNAVPGRLAWSFQVTCVGGDRNRCLWCVDKVTGTLTGIRLDLDDGRTGRIREPNDPGPVRRDDNEDPARFYVPLMFGVHVAG